MSYLLRSIPTAIGLMCDSTRFGVTVYRNTKLTDEGHIAFSRQLGDLEKVPKFRGPNVPDRFGYPELFDAGNTDLDGTIVKEGSR